MKTLQPLIILALLFTFIAWFSLQGVSRASTAPAQKTLVVPAASEPEQITVHSAAPMHQTPAKKPAAKAPEIDAKPSPLQIALQAGDFCTTVNLLRPGVIPQAEIWKAILATVQPSSHVIEVYGQTGPMLASTIPGADDPKAGKLKYAGTAAQLVWALKLGGAVYSPVSVSGDNAKAAREIFLQLQKKEPGNAVYPMFRLMMEEKLGFTKEQLKATAKEITSSSVFDTHMADIDRELHEALWTSPAVHYALSYVYSSWGTFSFDRPISLLMRMAQDGDFDGSSAIARLMTEQALHSALPTSSGDYDPSQYMGGRNLDPDLYKNISDLDNDRSHGPIKYAPSAFSREGEGRVSACDPGPYETYFYEARDAR